MIRRTGSRPRSSPTRRAGSRVWSAVVTVLSAVTVFVAAVAPGVIDSGSPLALARLPIECLLALVALILLPWRWARRAVAILAAVLLVAAAILATLDRVFLTTVGRPFDVVAGWSELGDGYGVVSDSAGSLGALALLVLVGLLVVAAADSVGAAASTVHQVEVAARDRAVFDRSAASDPYSRLPASDLLTGLKGKDVLVVFVESYGQVAVQDTSFAPGVDAVLRSGDTELAAHGYAERSAFLTSSTFGGISWLAHSTLQTGLWIDSQQKYDQVTTTTRFTLSDAFRKSGWQTLSDVPSDTRPWPIGSSFYHFGKQLNAQNVGYRGPTFSYARVPDQYTWAYLQKHELGVPHTPLMAEIDLVSSHTPWTPLPRLVPWDAVGDGSVYDPQPAEGLPPSVVWQSPQHVQQLYGQSIEYTMGALFSFLTSFDDPDLVLVVLGDHQPATVVSGVGANHQVPISIISKDRAVIDRIGSWKWQPGMLPSPSAPVWRMDAFRDRFLAAYGP